MAGRIEMSEPAEVRMTKRFRKKPVVIEAIQWTGENPRAITEFCGAGGAALDGGELTVLTIEGDLHASIGDWIVKGVKGEFYPCKPDIFAVLHGAQCRKSRDRTRRRNDGDMVRQCVDARIR